MNNTIRKLVIPSMLPVMFVNLYIINKFFDADIRWWAALGVYAITTLVPCAFALWYGWELRKEFSNEQNKGR